MKVIILASKEGAAMFKLFLAVTVVLLCICSQSQISADPDSEFIIVEGPNGPGLRFPVIHMHPMSRCYGHLTLSADRVSYAVEFGESSHAFDHSRSELVSVEKGHMGLLVLGVMFKFSSGEKFQMVPIREKDLQHRSGMMIRKQGRDEGPLLLAGQDFSGALNQLPVAAGRSGKNSNAKAVSPAADQRQSAMPIPPPRETFGTTPATASEVLASRASATSPSGLYALDESLTFNVVDGANFDAAGGRVTLFGHRDTRFYGPHIPYLQHLSVLLENSRPEFTLTWTKDSEQRVHEFMRHAETPEEARRLGLEWGQMSTVADFKLTPQARMLMRGLNVMPSLNGTEQPGYFGVEVKDTPDAFGVIVTRVEVNSPAARAGVRVGDKITQGPDGDYITADEFRRSVRFRGAGEYSFVVEGRSWIKTTLQPGTGELWDSMTTSDFVPFLWRAAGKARAADIVEAFYRHNRIIKKYPEMGEHSKRAYVETLYATGLFNEFDRLNREVYAKKMNVRDAEATLDRQTCGVIEKALQLPSGSMTQNFDSQLRRSRQVSDAYYKACLDPENFQPVTADALRIVWRKAGALQIAPEMIDKTFQVRPVVVPEYRGVRGDTLLGHAMLEADYLGKRLMDMPWLERKIPRYMTGYHFLQNHPEFDKDKATYHMWLSIGHMEAVQSPDHATLELRNIKMKFNIREYGPNGRDLPNRAGGYEELLTSLYDDLAIEFPVLHELSEAGKLAAIADWVRAKRPDFRLGQEGESVWQPPSQLPGLIYIYAHPPEQGANSATVAVIATGGVSLEPWVWSGKADLNPDTLPTDASVVDLRGLALTGSALGTGAGPVAMPYYDNQALSKLLNKKVDVPSWTPSGWVTQASKGKATLQLVSAMRGAANRSRCNKMGFDEKLQQLDVIANKLKRTEDALNEVNARSPKMTEAYERLSDDLKKDRDAFTQEAFDTTANLLFDLRHELNHGTIKQTAGGVAELRELNSTIEGWTSRAQNLLGSDDSARREEMRAMMKEVLQKLSAIQDTGAGKYLAPVFKGLNEAGKLKKVADLELGLGKVFLLSDWRTEQLTQQTDTDEQIRKALIPLQKKLSDQRDALLRDPALIVEPCW